LQRCSPQYWNYLSAALSAYKNTTTKTERPLTAASLSRTAIGIDSYYQDFPSLTFAIFNIQFSIEPNRKSWIENRKSIDRVVSAPAKRLTP